MLVPAAELTFPPESVPLPASGHPIRPLGALIRLRPGHHLQREDAASQGLPSDVPKKQQNYMNNTTHKIDLVIRLRHLVIRFVDRCFIDF